MLPCRTVCVDVTSVVSLPGVVRRISGTAVPVSCKSSSWMPGAGSGTWSCWTRLNPTSGLMVQSGFVQTAPKGQLYLGKVFSWASVCCCWASRRWWPGCSALPEGSVGTVRVRNGWAFQLFAVSLTSNTNEGIPLPGVLLLFVNSFFSTGGNWRIILNLVFKHLSACPELNSLGT